MKKLSALVFSLLVLGGASSFAEETAMTNEMNLAVQYLNSHLSAFDWKVGDTLNFDMRIKPISAFGLVINVVLAVTKIDNEGFTLIETLSYKKYSIVIETLLDKDTGQVKRMRVNGKDVETPKAAGTKIVKEEEAHIKVKAGEFDCIHVVMADKDNNPSEAWMNPSAVPISGLIKSSAIQGYATIEMELTSFVRVY